jgi:hypothetical protein
LKSEEVCGDLLNFGALTINIRNQRESIIGWHGICQQETAADAIGKDSGVTRDLFAPQPVMPQGRMTNPARSE